MFVRWLFVYLFILCSVNGIDVPFSKDYKKHHPDWQAGGAFQFHRSFHPCDQFEVECIFLPKQIPEQVFLHVNTTIIQHLDYVELTYDLGSMSLPKENDFIAVYLVDEEEQKDPTKIEPEDFDFFDHVLIDVKKGSKNQIVFGPLVNMRASYQFRYLQFAEEPFTYRNLGESAFVEMERGFTEPLQVHLALTSNPNEMRIMWTSGHVHDPQVVYGLHSGGNFSQVSMATSDTYHANDMCTPNATSIQTSWYRHPGYLHDAVLKELEPGRKYFYQVGSKSGVWSEEFNFTMPPKAGEIPTSPQSFFIFGDLYYDILEEVDTSKLDFDTNLVGISVPTLQGHTIDHILQDFAADNGSYIGLLHVGDISYARGRTYQWDQYGAFVQPIASSLPYMVALGNHEYDYMSGGEGKDLSGAGKTNGFHPPEGNYKNDSNGECGVPAAKRFHMPDNGNQMFWYSFEMGLVHHTVISSEHNFTKGSEMYTWLEKDLKQVNRQKTPWLFLYLHRSIYCSEDYEPDYQVSLLIRKHIEPLLVKFHVDLIFSGHYHAYERTCPVYDEFCRRELIDESKGLEKALAPIHIMVGSAGMYIDDVDFKDVPWSENTQLEYGYGRLHVYNQTHARFEFMRLRGRIVSDAHWIITDHDW